MFSTQNPENPDLDPDLAVLVASCPELSAHVKPLIIDIVNGKKEGEV
ncbi:MAG: hypothetical protein R6V10_07420 [bacterium]